MKHVYSSGRGLFIAALLWSVSGCALDDSYVDESPDKGTDVVDGDERASKSTIAVNVERVRYCTGSVFCNSALSSSQYHHWDDENVSNDTQKETMIARVYQPTKSAVRKLVFMAAGQQFGSGAGTNLTGQYNDFKTGWSKTQRNKWITLNPDSVPVRLINDGHVSSSDTFMALAFDARFQHTYSSSNKQEIEDAYYNWLRSKADVWNLDYIFLGGFSRGGCLVMRLARRFNRDYPDVPLIVASVDSVCKKGQSELGTYNVKIDNPVWSNTDAWGWATDITALFDNPGATLGVTHDVGADTVIWDPLNVRAFSHYQATDRHYSLGWYDQFWQSLAHPTMGYNNGLARTVIADFERHLRRFNADCTRLPRGAVAWWAGDYDGTDFQGENTLTSHNGMANPFDSSRFRHTLEFDGTDDYAEIPDHDSLDFGTGDFAMSMWIKTSDASGVKVILDKRREVTSYEGYHLFMLNGKLGFQLADGNYSNYVSNAFIADGQWHAIAVSVDRDDTSGLVFYVDGAVAGTFNPTGRSGSIDNQYPLRLGSRSTFTGGHADMVLDEVVLFDRALTGADAADYYYAQFGDDNSRCYARDSEVRLRHVNTGKCAYGNPVAGGAPKNWTCSTLPYLTYNLRYLGDNQVLLRNKQTEKCIKGSFTNGAALTNVRCDDVPISQIDPNLIYVIDDLGNGTARLRHKASGKCIYGNPSNGGALYSWSCWSDPNMVYALDPVN